MSRWRIFCLVHDFSRSHHGSLRDTTSWERVAKDDCVRSSFIELKPFHLSKFSVDPIHSAMMFLPHFLLVPSKTRCIQVNFFFTHRWITRDQHIQWVDCEEMQKRAAKNRWPHANVLKTGQTQQCERRATERVGKRGLPEGRQRLAWTSEFNAPRTVVLRAMNFLHRDLCVPCSLDPQPWRILSVFPCLNFVLPLSILNVWWSANWPHIRCGKCSRRNRSELIHCPVMKDQWDCVLNGLDGSVQYWNLFLFPPPFAIVLFHFSSDQCWDCTRSFRRYSFTLQNSIAPPSSRGRRPCRRRVLSCFDTG